MNEHKLPVKCTSFSNPTYVGPLLFPTITTEAYGESESLTEEHTDTYKSYKHVNF